MSAQNTQSISCSSALKQMFISGDAIPSKSANRTALTVGAIGLLILGSGLVLMFAGDNGLTSSVTDLTGLESDMIALILVGIGTTGSVVCLGFLSYKFVQTRKQLNPQPFSNRHSEEKRNKSSSSSNNDGNESSPSSETGSNSQKLNRSNPSGESSSSSSQENVALELLRIFNTINQNENIELQIEIYTHDEGSSDGPFCNQALPRFCLENTNLGKETPSEKVEFQSSEIVHNPEVNAPFKLYYPYKFGKTSQLSKNEMAIGFTFEGNAFIFTQAPTSEIHRVIKISPPAGHTIKSIFPHTEGDPEDETLTVDLEVLPLNAESEE